MASNQITINKVSAKPTSFSPNQIYVVNNTVSKMAELYFSTADGSALVAAVNAELLTKEVETVIKEVTVTGDLNQVHSVTNNAARLALVLDKNSVVYVADATGDGSITGPMLYVYTHSTKTFRSVISSSPTSISWSSITGKPTSGTTAIDTAVAASHNHSNKSVLDKLSQSADGFLTYDSGPPMNVFLIQQDW